MQTGDIKLKVQKSKSARSIALISCSAFLLASCASSSENISAQYVSNAQYNSYDCDQLGEEMSRVSARVSEVSGKQDDSATADAVSMGVGLVLFWPALFFLAATDDQKEELGRLKGEYEALQRVSTQKKCSFPAAPTDEEKKASTPNT